MADQSQLNPTEVAKQFCGFYYKNFNNKNELQKLYRPFSNVTFGDNVSVGFSALSEIWTKLGELHFGEVLTLDAQPTAISGAILVLVTGKVKAGKDDNDLLYAHSVQLVQDEAGSYCILNEIFRNVYG